MIVRALPVALALAVTLLAPAVHAQALEPLSQGDRVSLEADLWNSPDVDVLVWQFATQIRVASHLYVDAEVPYKDAGVLPSVGPYAHPGRGVEGLFGNPALGMHYATFLHGDLAVFAGGALTIPTLLQRDPSQDAAAAIANYPTAGYESERFEVETFSVQARVGLEARPASHLFWRGEIVPVLLLPFGADNLTLQQNAVYFFPETSSEIEGRAAWGFGGGLRVQAMLFLGGRFAERFSGAVEPYIGYEPSAPGVFVRLGLLVATNEPYGFGLDKDKVATARLLIGGKW